jgi:hypothetical protein
LLLLHEAEWGSNCLAARPVLYPMVVYCVV